nr:hypothetical protein GCM10020092_093760 [Actinoplanes digitatis]
MLLKGVGAVTDAPASLALRFEILGEVRALRGDERLDLGPAKQRAVLAVLLLDAGRPVPTHQIVDAVWGDGPPENGANVVQKYVAGLRRVLEPDRSPRTPGELIALTDGGYVLRTDPGTLDAERFQSGLARASAQRRAGQLAEAAETLREAVALWQGEALAGLPGPVFEAARNRLTDARATAWEKWADIELARGNHTGLMPDLVRLVEQFPLREGLRAQLMIALHQGGRQAEALAVFRDARAYFLDEFGVEPGERMQETHRRILRGEPFYSEPVDPWAASDDIPAPRGPVGVTPPAAPIASGSLAVPPSAYVQQYVPPDPTEIVPAPASPVHPPLSPWGVGAPPPPPAYAVPRRRFPVGEVIFAALTPLVVCSFGSWIYFVYAGARRRDRRQYLVAARLRRAVRRRVRRLRRDRPDVGRERRAEQRGDDRLPDAPGPPRRRVRARRGPRLAPRRHPEDPEPAGAGTPVRALRPGPRPPAGHRLGRTCCAPSTTADSSTSTTCRGTSWPGCPS